VPLDQLKPAPYNPRTIDDDALRGLAESIRRGSAAVAGHDGDGYRLEGSIVINRRGMRIIAGHQRVKALRLLGQDWIDARDITWVEYEPDSSEEKAAVISLNNPYTQGQFTPALAPLLLEVEASGIDLESLKLDKLLPATGFRPGKGHLRDRVSDWRSTDDFFACPEAVRAGIEKRGRCIVQFSGGYDSLATLLWVRRNFPELPCIAVFTDTGVEFPGLPAYVCEIAEQLSAEPVIVKPKHEWWSWLRQEGAWPSLVYRPCAYRFIHAPFAEYVTAKYKSREVTIFTGSRAEEAVRGTEKTAESPLSSFGKRRDDYQHYAPCFNVRKDVIRAVVEACNLPLWDGYARGFVRTACWCCPGQCGLQAAALAHHYPGLADDIRRWEKRIGPMRPLDDCCFDDLVRSGEKARERAET